MMKTMFKILSLPILLVGLSGCGDLSKKEVITNALSASQFKVNCELDVTELSKIMEENISSQIRCLEENLNLFIQVVESPKKGYLSRVGFEAYVRKNRKEITEDTVKALQAVFKLNYLITGEDPDYISRENMKKLIDFAIVFNDEASLHFGPFFKSTTPVTFALHMNHRERAQNSSKAIMMALRRLFNSSRGESVHKLNLVELLDSFVTDDTREDIEKVKKVLFAKKIILGGDPEVLTNTELERLILNFDSLILVALDANRYQYITEFTQESMLQLLKLDVDALHGVVFGGAINRNDDESLFKLDEVFNAITTFVSKEDFDVEKFKSLISEVKRIAVGGDTKEVKTIELKRLFNHANSVLQTGTVFHRIYAKFKDQLSNPRPVDIDFDEYRHTYPENQKELEQFERIVKKYRYFKGEFLSAYYTLPYRRNADGVVEIAILEYLLQIAMKEFGSPSNALGGYSINLDQVQAVMTKFENDLINMELILPGMKQTTGNNIALLGTLFQSQSDNNQVMDVNEGAEFAVGLITSLKMGTQLINFFEEQKCEFDQFKRVEPACFRRHFFQGFCKKYRQFYPRLFDAYNTPVRCEDIENSGAMEALLDRSIYAARVCNIYTDGAKEEIYYSEADIVTILEVILHIEVTINRWDKNNNNFLDANEVNDAYAIYSGALDGFLVSKPGIIKKFKKQIFQYMVKYEEIPDEKNFGSIWKFIRFILSFDKRVTANRKTIASILYQISVQNMLLPGYVPFNCNYLRDPEHIPRSKFVRKISDEKQQPAPDFSAALVPFLEHANP